MTNKLLPPPTVATHTTTPHSTHQIPNWVRVGQKVRFRHESYSYDLVGRIDHLEKHPLKSGEIIFGHAIISYWKPRKKDGLTVGAELLTYNVHRLDWLRSPLPGELTKPNIDELTSDTKQNAETLPLTPLPQPEPEFLEAPEEQFLQASEESTKSLANAELSNEERLSVGCRVRHNGGEWRQFHSLYGLQCLVVEHFGGDLIVHFSDERPRLRCTLDELELVE